MTTENSVPDTSTKKEKLSFFDQLMEIVGWLQIAVSPTIVGIVLAFFLYYFIPNIVGLALAIVVAVAGLVTGIVWATKKWRQKQTIAFMSRTMATPELDKLEEE
jgi:hypothetical protein